MWERTMYESADTHMCGRLQVGQDKHVSSTCEVFPSVTARKKAEDELLPTGCAVYNAHMLRQIAFSGERRVPRVV